MIYGKPIIFLKMARSESMKNSFTKKVIKIIIFHKY